MTWLFDLPFLALAVVGAVAALWHLKPEAGTRRALEGVVDAAAERLEPVLSFFGIRGLPGRLAVAVTAATAGGAGLLLDALARAHFGSIPWWFLPNALLSAAAVGLLAAKLVGDRFYR